MDISNLPNEVLQHIFGFLDHQSRLTVLEVCHQWNALASSAQFMDRIWFRIVMRETKFMDQVNALKYSSRKYRHVIIDCGADTTPRTASGSMHHSPKMKIEKILTAVDNVQTLMICTLGDITATALLMLLQNVSNLRRLYLLGKKVGLLQDKRSISLQLYESEITVNYPSLIDIFRKQSSLVLQNVTDVTFTVPFIFNIRVDVFQQVFPNLNQLQVAVNDPSIVHLIDAYKSQLEKLAVFSISSDLLTLFCGIKFPKLSNFHLYTDFFLDERALAKCEQFFEDLDHLRNLRHLKLLITDASLIKTICSSCTTLRVLEVCTTSFGFLQNISNLMNLQKLSIRKRYCDPLSSSLYRFIFFPNPEEFWQVEPVESLKIVEINGSFRTVLNVLLNTIAPNLEMLVLEEFTDPEEALRILAGSSPKIRHLKFTFKNQSGKPPKLDSAYLMNKTNLVTYSLDNVLIDDDSIPKWIQMAPNLRTIIIENCETLNVDHLMIFSSCCPKLTQLELKGCSRITAQGLNEIKQILPHVAIINHVEQEQIEQGFNYYFLK